MEIEAVSCADAALLTQMFLELMADEHTDTPVNEAQAARRMGEYLARGDKAFVFQAQGESLGYALVIYDRTPLYLRHFYICRHARRKGYGTAAFRALLKTLDTDTIDLDVFVWNERGKAFWKSLGFAPRALMMRYRGAGS
jgi:GNAT superfamily N-acetyltransferase